MLAGVLRELTREGVPDVLLIVPPFGGVDRPSLGVHILQALGRQAGLNVRVLYANLLLARDIGVERYTAICYAPTSDLLGERFFTHAAFGDEPRGAPRFGEPRTHRRVSPDGPTLTTEEFSVLRSRATDWCDTVAKAVVDCGVRIVGLTTTFEQTSASFALLDRIKRLDPSITTLIGGANCEGEMALGIHTLGASIDHIFSGESEGTFVPTVREIIEGGRPHAIIDGTPNTALDDIPTPSFDDYYITLESVLPDSALQRDGNIWLPYESSRGCWWGQKHHCTFCGINGTGMKFREKSPQRVIDELRVLRARHPSNKVLMVDNIMPHTFFTSLLPRLGEEVPDLFIFYEQKANLTLDKLELLRNAGVGIIQPGIEALATPLLRHMKKGVSAAQNIALLRYALAAGIDVNWNLLYGFPGDDAEWYVQTTAMLPALHHLAPPTDLYHLSIDRFSPYFNRPADYGLHNLRPGEIYHAVFPAHVDIDKLAYHFVADYPSGSTGASAPIQELAAAVAQWSAAWKQEDVPKLLVSELDDDEFAVFDSRGIEDNEIIAFIGRDQARAMLLGSAAPYADLAWAEARQYCLRIDGRLVPLAVAEPALIHAFERELAPGQRGGRMAGAREAAIA
ncbi:RiPP maturation radical SAM C-methyltransferase [Microbacteriaceae bacterium K1510]|nr:RiPP maturation radical SAM C-methyltransferase [Microbacteriaceae bacterium K1510]